MLYFAGLPHLESKVGLQRAVWNAKVDVPGSQAAFCTTGGGSSAGTASF